MPMTRSPSRAAAAILAVALLTACAGPSGSAPAESPSVAPSATASASDTPTLSLGALDAEPADDRDESVALAFDHDGAAAILKDVPADLDFGAQAVVCVFLGPRQTTGWSLDLRTATLREGQLEIQARENAPRANTRPEVTYPADCGLLTRAALPPGELAVRADDTITGEFIAGTTVVVPAASNAP
jgi:hypothetical protein